MQSSQGLSVLRPLSRLFGESRTWLDGRPLWQVLSDLRQHPSYAGMLRPDTPSGAHTHYQVMTRVFAREHAERARLGEWLTVEGCDRIDPQKGYIVRDLADHPAVKDGLARCDEIRTGPEFDNVLQKHGRQVLRTYPLRQDEPLNEAIFRLATDPVLLAPIADYLGGIPVLQTAMISYSPNRESVGQSQYYHLDSEDHRQIKCNIYIKDVDEDTGPLTIMRADDTRRLFDRLHQQGAAPNRGTYLDDDLVRSASGPGPGEAESLCGPRGTVSLVDTSNCFHYGSRRAKKSRLALYFHYVSAFAVSLPLWGRHLKDHPLVPTGSPEMDRIRTLVLGLPHLPVNRARDRKRQR